MTRARPAAAALAALVLIGGCRGDEPVVTTPDDAAVVVGRVEHTLVGAAGRRGAVTADTALLGERMGTLLLIRPRLSLSATPARGAVEIVADTGVLDVATGMVRLIRPSSVVGASPDLTGRDTVLYDPVGDSIRALAAGGTTTPR